MRLFATLLPLLTLAVSAHAHAIFQELYVNGVSAGHMVGIRVPDYNGPIENVDSNDLICNGGINPYRQPVSNVVIDVPAGSTVTARWQHTLFNGHIIDDSHKGPVMTYLAKVDDATSLSVTGLKWFKIAEEGLDKATGKWAVDKLIANNGRWDIKIPDCIPPGEYLLRHELIALHSAANYPGAQFYMECAQIRITGAGGNASPPTVSIPGLYKGTDPGVRVNIWTGLTDYVIPGPRPFTCGGSNPPTTQPPTTQPPTTQPPTTQPPTTQPPTTQPPTTQPPTTQPPTTQPPTGGAAQWAQCGGIGHSGPTTCQSPYTCVVLNDYYHQCQ